MKIQVLRYESTEIAITEQRLQIAITEIVKDCSSANLKAIYSKI